MRTIILTTLVLSAGAASAQTAPPSTAPAPATVPTLQNYSLPPAGPQPAATPVPVPTSTPTVTLPPASAPKPVRTPRPAPPREAPEPAAAATPTPAPPPIAVPTPTPAPAPSAPAPAVQPAAPPVAEATPAPVAPAAGAAVEPAGFPWLWALLAAAVLAAIAGWALLRRRSAVADEVEPVPVVLPEAAPVAAPSAVPPAPHDPHADDRPWLELHFRPKRAGTNLLSAAVEYELTLTNNGRVGAHDIRVAGELLSASAGQDAEIVALYDDTIDLPIAPPFALEPGASRLLEGYATRARNRLEVIPIQGRPMFVPIVALRARYAYGADSAGLVTATYVVGVERAGDARMGPIWLDQPPKMRSDVGARAYVAGKAGVRRIGSPEAV